MCTSSIFYFPGRNEIKRPSSLIENEEKEKRVNPSLDRKIHRVEHAEDEERSQIGQSPLCPFSISAAG